MAAIQPRSRTDCKFDKLDEKTAAAGVTLQGILKFTTALLKPLVTTCDLGTLTAADHFRTLFVKAVQSYASATMPVGTYSAQDLQVVSNGIARMTVKGLADSSPEGALRKRLGHAAYTSGGEIEEVTAAATSTSTTPVTLFTYTINQVQTQVSFEIHLTSRDNTAGTMSHITIVASGSRAAGAAVAGSVGSAGASVGTALHTVTVANSGNTILLKIQNVSGSNTTYGVALIRVIPVSTST